MKQSGITKYPYHHCMFKTDGYYEVHVSDDELDDDAVAVALFGDLERAEAYLKQLEDAYNE
jgi:hypothetical protein